MQPATLATNDVIWPQFNHFDTAVIANTRFKHSQYGGGKIEVMKFLNVFITSKLYFDLA